MAVRFPAHRCQHGAWLLVTLLTLACPAASAAAPFAYISGFGANQVKVIDTATNTVTATIPAGASPYGVAIAPDGGKVYVANASGNNVSVIDTATNTVVSTIGVGPAPWSIAVSPDGSRAYAGNRNGSSVSVIDTATNTVIATIPLPGAAPLTLDVSPDGTRVYVTRTYGGGVSVIDATTNTLLTTIPTPVGGFTAGVVVIPQGTKAYVTHYRVADGGSSRVSVISTATNTVLTTVNVDAGSWAITHSPDGTRVYVVHQDSNTIKVIDTATDTVVATVTGFSTPVGISSTPDGGRLYVAEIGSANVRVVDTATNTITTSIPTGMTAISVGRFIIPPSPLCGNGLPQVGEQCDDGNGVNGDGCDNNCTTTACGNGITTASEQCDDGNFAAGDCCSATCQHETSGSPCAADSNECTDDECDGAGACVHPDSGLGTPCTPDFNPCTDDVCDGASSCGVPNTDPCDDGLFCNGADTCTGGACDGHAGDPCVGGTECADACNEASDDCFDASNTACTDDGNGCTNDECDGAGNCTGIPNTDPCDDGLFCNGADNCSGGTCSAHGTDPCQGGPECADNCNESLDSCSEPDGTPCNDSDVCTIDDQCAGGACTGDSMTCGDGAVQGACGETCDDGNAVLDDGCDEMCQLEACGPAPDPLCKQPFFAGKASIKLKNDPSEDADNSLLWKWTRGAQTDKNEFGDPVSFDDYWLCVYDDGELVSTTRMPAAGTCEGKPCWSETSKGFKFKSKAGVPDGANGLSVSAGGDGKAKAKIKARGADLDLPDLSTIAGPLVVQLVKTSGGTCWAATYSSPFLKEDGVNLADRAD
jgi:YVTN family beta-propeller protein/cysteine-rich repeat protein